MTLIQKILIGTAAMMIVGGSAYLAFNQINKEQSKHDNLEKIVKAYEDLLNEAEKIQTSSSDCSNKNLSQDIKNLEEKLSKLNKRAKAWWESRPKLPDLPSDIIDEQNKTKIESPRLTDEQEKQIEEDLFGSKESSKNAPPLPNLNEEDIEMVDYDIEKLKNLPTKIKSIIDTLKKLNDTCNKKAMDAISDKCEDACVKYKKCAAWSDATAEDLADAYDSCMVECTGSETPLGWSKKVIKCINAVEIKKPNDCVIFVNCQLPEQMENKYAPIKEYYKKLNNK